MVGQTGFMALFLHMNESGVFEAPSDHRKPVALWIQNESMNTNVKVGKAWEAAAQDKIKISTPSWKSATLTQIVNKSQSGGWATRIRWYEDTCNRYTAKAYQRYMGIFEKGHPKTHRQLGRFCRRVYLWGTPNPSCWASSWAWRLASVSWTSWSRPAVAPVRPAAAAPDHYWWPSPTAGRCWGGWPCRRRVRREFVLCFFFVWRGADWLWWHAENSSTRAARAFLG